MDLDQDDIGLAELLRTVRESAWLIAGVIILSLSAAAAYVLIVEPVYRADALLQVEQKAQAADALREMLSTFEEETAVSAEIEILKSRMVLGLAVRNLKLDISIRPRHFPGIGAAIARRSDPEELAEAWFGLEEYAWGGERIQIETFAVPDELLGLPFTLVAGADGLYDLLDAAEVWIAQGRVGEAKQIGLITGETIDFYVSELRARPGTRFELKRKHELEAVDELREALTVQEQGTQSNVLKLSLEGPDPDRVRTIINEILNIYLRQNVERKSAEAAKTLEFLDAQLPTIKDQMENAEARLNNYRLERGSIDLPKETQVILEKVVTVEAQLSQLKREREELTQKFTPRHPRVAALDAQIRGLNGDRIALDEEVYDLPDTQQEVLRLSRDVKVNTELYTFLMNRSQELRVVEAGTVGNVRILDYALAPYKPVKPQKLMAAVLALGAGVFFGVAAALIRRSVRSGIDDPELVERELGVSVYASVPHSSEEKKLLRRRRRATVDHALLAALAPEDLAIESLRSLRTSLHFALLDAKNNVLLITGPAPGVGKSWLSANFAAVLAMSGKRVLLIDADLRAGRINRYVGIERQPGLSEYIIGECERGQVVHRIVVEHLDVVPTGVMPPNPSELLLHDRFAEFLHTMSSQYDHVIIDSPPVLAVTDPAIIGRLSGAALLVVKAGVHPLREIDQSIRRLQQAGVNLKGVVFNDVESARALGNLKYYGMAYSYPNRKQA